MDATPTTRPSLLVRLCNPQDERAWHEFTAIYSPLIYRLARRKGLQDADAADLVQEVLRAVASAIDRFEPDPARGPFRNWLFRIAHNLMMNFLANQGRHPRGRGGDDVVSLLEIPAVASQEDSALFELEFRRQLFQWASEQIREEFHASTWSAFWKTWVEGKKPKDVAAEIGMSLGAIYMARSRVVARLREVISAIEHE
jgi:RNA polymerase sigma factor (sigma-70 family)